MQKEMRNLYKIWQRRQKNLEGTLQIISNQIIIEKEKLEKVKKEVVKEKEKLRYYRNCILENAAIPQQQNGTEKIQELSQKESMVDL